MVILLILLIPITSIITGFLTLKAYNRGLAHNYDLKHDTKPMEPKNPIVEILQAKSEKKEEKNQVDLNNEWLNDPRDED